MKHIIILLIIAIIIRIIKEYFKGTIKFRKFKTKNNQINNDQLPYKKKHLLTKNELFFYQQMQPIVNELGYCILSKIRIADLVEVEKNLDYSTTQTYFNKISKKHIDFALCDPKDLTIHILIELDDKSHNLNKVKERDKFVKELYKKTDYKLIRVYNIQDFKNELLKIESFPNEKYNIK